MFHQPCRSDITVGSSCLLITSPGNDCCRPPPLAADNQRERHGNSLELMETGTGEENQI